MLGLWKTRKLLSPKTRSSGLLNRPNKGAKPQAVLKPRQGGLSCRVTNGTTANIPMDGSGYVPGLSTCLLAFLHLQPYAIKA